jgi:hypothetical protein
MRLHVKLGGPSQAISKSLWPRLRKEPDHDLRGMPRQSTSPLGHKRVVGDTAASGYAVFRLPWRDAYQRAGLPVQERPIREFLFRAVRNLRGRFDTVKQPLYIFLTSAMICFVMLSQIRPQTIAKPDNPSPDGSAEFFVGELVHRAT